MQVLGSIFLARDRIQLVAETELAAAIATCCRDFGRSAPRCLVEEHGHVKPPLRLRQRGKDLLAQSLPRETRWWCCARPGCRPRPSQARACCSASSKRCTPCAASAGRTARSRASSSKSMSCACPMKGCAGCVRGGRGGGSAAHGQEWSCAAGEEVARERQPREKTTLL